MRLEFGCERSLGKDIQAFDKLIKIVISNKFFRLIYRRYSAFKVFIEIFLNCSFKKENNLHKFNTKTYYAGAKIANIGGPYLKIKKLQKFFPEYKRKFNLIYALSNSPKLNSWSLNIIKKRNIPLILNQNGVFYPAWYEGNWENQNLLISKVYHSADYVFWQSNFCKKASERFLGKRMGRGEILYNAIDTKKFYPVKKNPDNIFRFLINGNIRKKNNYRIYSVLEAFKEIVKKNKYTHLYIAGIIEDFGFFNCEVDKLNLRKFITFLGPYSQKDAPMIYQKVDAYITMSFQDNCPSAVIEAMSCGLPILYSSSGGIPELVGKNSGIGLNVSEDWEKVNVPSKKQIYQGLLEIMDKGYSMSDSARYRAVKLFDIYSWIKRHREVFEFLIDNV